MDEEKLAEISNKLNVIISLTLRQLLNDRDIAGTKKRKRGAGDQVRYLADMGIDAKDIAIILGAPLASVRTLLTPKRRR
jgi:hypothetical protein